MRFVFDRKKSKPKSREVKKGKISVIFSAFQTHLVLKMISIIASIVLLGNIILLSYVISNIRESKIEESIRINESAAAETAKSIEGFISKVYGYSDYFQQTMNIQRLHRILTRPNVKMLLENYLKNSPDYIFGFYILGEPKAIDELDFTFINTDTGDSKGRGRIHTIKNYNTVGNINPYLLEPEHTVNLDDTEYYSKVKETLKPYVSSPYVVKEGENEYEVISFSMPISVHGTDFNGIVGTEIYADSFNSVVKEATNKIGMSGLAMNNGEILAYGEDYKYSGEKIDSYFSKDLADDFYRSAETGKPVSRLDHASGKLYCFSPVLISEANVNWVFWSEIPIHQFMSGVNQLMTVMTIISIVSILVVIITVSGLVAKQITPIKALTSHIEKFADADFTGKISPGLLKRRDEIGKLASSTQKMQQSVTEIIRSVRKEAAEVAEAVATVKKYIDNLHLHIETISSNTQELSASLIDTSASANQMDQAVDSLKNAVETIKSNAEKGNMSSAEIKNRAQQVFEKVRKSGQENQALQEATQKKLEEAISESRSIQKITNLLDNIMAVASQTNLLSLNAAIEAARAGEYGAGFSVVAEEIRKLAVQAKDNASQIQDISNLVLLSVNNLSESADELLNYIETNVNESYNLLDRTGEQYNQDARLYQEMSMKLFSTAESLSSAILQLNNTIEKVAAATNDGAKGASVIADEASKILIGSEDVLNKAVSADENASRLREAVEKFIIDD